MEAIEVSETQVEERPSDTEEDQDLDEHEFEVETRLSRHVRNGCGR
jgi:hypothetical protein